MIMRSSDQGNSLAAMLYPLIATAMGVEDTFFEAIVRASLVIVVHGLTPTDQEPDVTHPIATLPRAEGGDRFRRSALRVRSAPSSHLCA